MIEQPLTVAQQKTELLQQMGQIECLIRGKLTSQSYVYKGHTQGPYFTLQRWQQGKNQSQRIKPPQLPLIQAAIGGYERFQQLAEQFMQLAEQQTWAEQSAELKKKLRRFQPPLSPPPRPSSKKPTRK
jgi:hypothetical protein